MTPSKASARMTPTAAPEPTPAVETGHGYTCDPACRCDANIASGRGGNVQPVPSPYVLMQRIEMDALEQVSAEAIDDAWSEASDYPPELRLEILARSVATTLRAHLLGSDQ